MALAEIRSLQALWIKKNTSQEGTHNTYNYSSLVPVASSKGA